MKLIQTYITALFVLLLVGQTAWAQTGTEGQAPAAALYSPQAEAMFVKMMPKTDSTFIKKKLSSGDTFAKRWSFHFNTVDWLTTVPSMGIEFDLNKTEKNNRSLLVFGKFKPEMTHTVKPSMKINVNAVRLEFRKYWRTGNHGKNDVTYDIPRFDMRYPRIYTRDSVYYDPDTGEEEITVIPYYPSSRDVRRAERFNGDPAKGASYNRYHQFRRNYTSTRTIQNPRNWRAYYLGAYADYDKFDILLSTKGVRGQGFSAGMTLGWSIPLLTREYPNEGGLDLDLGALLGVKMAKYDRYHYVSGYNADDESIVAHYINDPSKSQTNWGIVKWPVVQEVRVALVYRFRSISHKVSLQLVDDYYKKWVEGFKDNKNRNVRALEQYQDSMQRVRQMVHNKKVGIVSYVDNYDDEMERLRLENAMRLNPDTVFDAHDDSLYLKVAKGIDLENLDAAKMLHYRDSVLTERRLAEEKEKLAAIEEAKKKDREAKRAKRLAAEERKKAKAEAKHSDEADKADDEASSDEHNDDAATGDEPQSSDQAETDDKPADVGEQDTDTEPAETGEQPAETDSQPAETPQQDDNVPETSEPEPTDNPKNTEE